MIALGVASSILTASSFAAKPPKTTEWIAPIRVQASIAIKASGIIGIYMITRSPDTMPLLAKPPANDATWVCKFAYVVFDLWPVTGLS